MKRLSRKSERFTAESLYKLIEDETLNLDADYQRERIWDLNHKRRLIQTMLRELDIPKIYLVKTKEGYDCVDGKQRLTVIKEFFENEFALTGEYFTEFPEYLDKKFSEISNQKKLTQYSFDVVVFDELTIGDVEDLFDRLNFGIALNTGERINAIHGLIRDFIFETLGKNGPFIRNTKITEVRYARQAAVAQCVLNSYYFRGSEFRRTRYEELRDFFKETPNTKETQDKLLKIKNVLEQLDEAFSTTAALIRSRAAFVSAYLFGEELIATGKKDKLPAFVKEYSSILSKIKEQKELLKSFRTPTDAEILEKFQKHLEQASSESKAIDARHAYLKEKLR